MIAAVPAAANEAAYLASDESTASADRPLSIVVSLGLQRLFVYRDGQMIGVSPVSTGMTGHETPLGAYAILQKNRWHRSNLYSNAPMPFMQRLTWDGIALHAGALPGYPASHGCIRLPAAFAKQLFALTDLGAEVSVIDWPGDTPYRLPFQAFDWTAKETDLTSGFPALPRPAPAAKRAAIWLDYSPSVFRE